jgi:hypothetical protein
MLLRFVGSDQVATAGDPVLPPDPKAEFGFGVDGGVEGHDVGGCPSWVGSSGWPTCGGVEPHPGSRDLAIDVCAAGRRDISEGAGRETLDAPQFCAGLSTVKQPRGVQSLGMHGESAERISVVEQSCRHALGAGGGAGCVKGSCPGNRQWGAVGFAGKRCQREGFCCSVGALVFREDDRVIGQAQDGRDVACVNAEVL